MTNERWMKLVYFVAGTTAFWLIVLTLFSHEERIRELQRAVGM